MLSGASDTRKISGRYLTRRCALIQLMLRGAVPLIKRKRVPSEQFESFRIDLDHQLVGTAGGHEEHLVSSSSRYSKRQCPSPSAGPEGLAAVAVIYQFLLHWKVGLQALQAKCILADDVIYRAVDLFIRYREQVQDVSWDFDSFSDSEQLPSELAACLWLATKTTGNRSCLPSRTLICRATEIDPGVISTIELQILIALDWHVAFNSRLPEEEESVASMSPASQDYAWPGLDCTEESPPELWQCQPE